MSGDTSDYKNGAGGKGVLWASSRERPAMLLLTSCNTQGSSPQQRIIQPKMSVMARLKNSGLKGYGIVAQ